MTLIFEIERKFNFTEKYKTFLWSQKRRNTPTGASTNPKKLDLNKNLNLIEIEN